MKKLLVLVCILGVLSSCYPQDYTKQNTDEKVFYDLGSKLWNNGRLEKIETEIKIEIDKNLALEIGDAVLSAYTGEKSDNTDLTISFVANQDFYIVSRLHVKWGGELCVAISKIDGKILKIWHGDA